MPTVRAAEGVIAPFEFRASTNIAWLTDSSLAIIDSDDQQIVIVSTTGKELRRIGGKGMGPGEFTGLVSLRVNAEGELVVGDVMAMRLSRFDADLSFVESVSVPGPPWEILDWTDNRAVVLLVPLMPTQGPMMGVVDFETGSVVSSVSIFDKDSSLAIPMEHVPVPGVLHTNLTATSLRPGAYALASPLRYRIAVMDEAGRLIDTFERPEVERVEPTEEEMREAEARIRKMMATLSPPPPPEGIEMAMRLIRAPKPHFRHHGFAADDEGRLWIATERGDAHSTAIDVLGSDGGFLTTIVLPHQVRGMAFRSDMLAALVERKGGEFDGQFGVQLYEVTAVPGSDD